jgi:hypothetical protein
MIARSNEHLGARDISLPPTEELSWPEFEDYVEAVLSAHRFSIGDGVRITGVTKWGRPGDKQHGIDLKGEWSNGKTAIWQCKQYRKLSPRAVAKAVAACEVDADEHYLVFSGIASSEAQNKIAEYPGWQILDKRGLAQLLKDAPLQRQRQILDETWDPVTRRRILALPGADAFETVDRLAALRQSSAPLNDRGSFVGRVDERRKIDTVLDTGDTKVVLITGSGGMGKSRLAIEALDGFQASHATIPVLSLLEGHGLHDGNLDELPHAPAVLLVDDGDDRLGAVEHLVQYAIRNPKTHLVITCRKQRIASIRDLLLHARLPTNSVETVDVGPLTPRQARDLVDDLADGLNLTYPAKLAIARLTEEAPFLGVLSVNLIRSGDLTGTLSLNQDLRNQVLAGYRRSLTSAFAGHTPEIVERLLATCAALGPLDPKDASMRCALADFVGLPEIELTQLLADLANAEILRPTDSGLQVAPDILADVLLESASFSDSLYIATGFTDRLWESFYSFGAAQLLRQLTNLNWRLQMRGLPSVIDGIWDVIRHEIQGADINGLREAVDRLQTLSFTAPRELLSLLDDIRSRIDTIATDPPDRSENAPRGGLTHTKLGASERHQFGLRAVTPADVMKALAPLYAQCARSDTNLLEQALDGLWAIHQVLALPASSQPTEAVKAAKRLLEVGTLASESFPERAVERTRAWAATRSDGSAASPFFLLKPLLAKHGETTKQTAARLITIERYLVNADWARPHRDAIRALLLTHAIGGDVVLAAEAVHMLEEALQRQFAAGGLVPDTEESARWDADDLATIAVLKSAAHECDSAIIRRLIRSALAWHSLHAEPESRHAALVVVTELDNRSDDLAQVILHSQGFGLRSRRGLPVPSGDDLRNEQGRPREITHDEYDAWEAERAKQTKACVDQLWGSNGVHHALDLIERELTSAIRAVGDRASLHDLGHILATERVDLCPEATTNIAQRAAGLLDRLLVYTLAGWKNADENSLLLWLNGIGAHRPEVRKAVGAALSANGWAERNRQYLAILEKGRRDTDPAVRAEFHRASHQLLAARPGTIARSLLAEDIERGPATDVLRSVALRSNQDWIPTLEADDLTSILQLAGRADINDYGVEVLLANIASRYPRQVLNSLTDLSAGGARLSPGPRRLADTLILHGDVISAWVVDMAATVDAIVVINVIEHAGKKVLDGTFFSAITESVQSLSATKILEILKVLQWCADFWPLRFPSLAQRIIQQVGAVAPQYAETVRQSVATDAARPMTISSSNGQCPELEEALPLAIESARMETDPQLRSIFEAAAALISEQIDQLRRRNDEDID